MNRMVLFSSSTDRWETPHAVKEALYREFALNYDPCPLDGVVNGLAPLFSRWWGKRPGGVGGLGEQDLCLGSTPPFPQMMAIFYYNLLFSGRGLCR